MVDSTIYNKEYYDKAQSHNQLMIKYYNAETEYSIENSKVYRNSIYNRNNNGSDNINITLQTTTEALYENANHLCCLLNFASFRHPGGGFIKGSMAQEESLCHESNLYNVIGNEKFVNDYNLNREYQNNGLYSNFGIYSPSVMFIDSNGNEHKCDVITCASPNYREAKKHNISLEENNKVLKDRIEFILNIAQEHCVDTLILGAFGTGVFEQDTEIVAKLFKELLQYYSFNKVIFAIPNNKKYEIFINIFNKKEE